MDARVQRAALFCGTIEFLSYGFQYVTLDLKGYRTGSMNEALHLTSEDAKKAR